MSLCNRLRAYIKLYSYAPMDSAVEFEAHCRTLLTDTQPLRASHRFSCRSQSQQIHSAHIVCNSHILMNALTFLKEEPSRSLASGGDDGAAGLCALPQPLRSASSQIQHSKCSSSSRVERSLRTSLLEAAAPAHTSRQNQSHAHCLRKCFTFKRSLTRTCACVATCLSRLKSL